MYDFEISILMRQCQPVLNSELCDETIDDTSNGETAPAQIEEDAGGIPPLCRLGFDIVLPIQIAIELIPLIIVSGSLKQLQLTSAAQDNVLP